MDGVGAEVAPPVRVGLVPAPEVDEPGAAPPAVLSSGHPTFTSATLDMVKFKPAGWKLMKVKSFKCTKSVGPPSKLVAKSAKGMTTC